ncbi:hypothetical protein [Mycobacterium sp. 1164985.4]|uniref:hypothetical protein n=1 Tax=Mycobacterium sp. 1164985.4 TaxID=1834069 RepID=UPI0007FEC451|nr:hypothetical protein [Mycobacterium sp. 1164985.4]OBK78837.1 hypothetical protein A5650_09585 [Mycobacterium sp. 1164985.4]
MPVDAVTLRRLVRLTPRSASCSSGCAADHRIVVLGIDFTERVVYVNDSAYDDKQGEKLKVPHAGVLPEVA